MELLIYTCPECKEEFEDYSNQKILCPHCETPLELDWDADIDHIFGVCNKIESIEEEKKNVEGIEF